MSDPGNPNYNPFWEESEEYAISDEANEATGTVHVDGLPIPVQNGRLTMVNLATLQQRLTFGDYSLASDNFLSVWVQSDWTGGGQIGDIREASHTERFRHATAHTMNPRMLTQPLETVSYTVSGAPAAAYPVGDFFPSGGSVTLFYAAFDDALYSWDTGTEAFVSEIALSADPVNKGVVYDDEIWIPLGINGLDVWDGAAGAVTHYNDPTPVSILEWDDKLLLLEHDGQITIWDGAIMDSPTELRLRGNRVPRHLVLWWSQEGFPTVYVVTNRDVWVIDPLIPRLYRTGLRFPVHPDHGLGAASWRDDAMYVSVGVGVHQLARGGTISAMGLDRDDGLPSHLRGRIVDMEPEYNGLLALVQGLGTVDVDSGALGPTIESTSIYGDALVVAESSVNASSTLQRWTGMGWHTLWESPGSDGVPTRVMVSEADGEYRMWWGYGGSMYSQMLRRTFHNPRQGAQLGIDRFALSSSIRTGRFDANVTNFHKLASHVEVHFDPESTGEVDVYYYTDHFDERRLLGTVSGTGVQHILFNPDGVGVAEGDSFHWIEFEYELHNTDPTETVIVNWISLYFIVIPLQTRSWRIPVPLRHTEQWTARGPREIAEQFDNLAAGERFVTFKHRDQTYRVRLAQTQGDDGTGDDWTGNRTISLIEVGPIVTEADD